MAFSHRFWHSRPEASPLFCARCRVAHAGQERLCRHCGDTLLCQGYCEVCEDYWMLPAGSVCPKHEIPLLEQPPPRECPDPEAGRLVTVAALSSSEKAEVLRIRLEAEGIPTFLQGQRMGSSSMYQVATGGVKLQVPERFLTDARILLGQTWNVKAGDDLDDAWDELAPDPGAERRTIMQGLILLILFAPIVLGLALWVLQAHWWPGGRGG